MCTSDKLLTTAKAVREFWEHQGVTVIATDAEVIGSLNALADSGFLNIEILDRVPIDVQVQLVVDAIKLFQKSANAEPSGVLDRRTQFDLRRLRNCDTSASPSALPDRLETGVIHYCVTRDFPARFAGESTRDLLAHAWQGWIMHLPVRIRMVDLENTANVLIQWKDLNDPSRLGSSTLGGPDVLSAHQLTVIFNSSAAPPFDDDPGRFLSTAAHEFGHILGLGHVPTAGQLMSALFEPGLLAPTHQDIVRAQAIWGAEETDWNSRLLQCNPWELESLARRLGLNPALLPPRNVPSAARVSSILDMAKSRGKMPELATGLEQVRGDRLVS